MCLLVYKKITKLRKTILDGGLGPLKFEIVKLSFLSFFKETIVSFLHGDQACAISLTKFLDIF